MPGKGSKVLGRSGVISQVAVGAGCQPEQAKVVVGREMRAVAFPSRCLQTPGLLPTEPSQGNLGAAAGGGKGQAGGAVCSYPNKGGVEGSEEMTK